MNERIRELAIDWADQLDWDFPSDPKEYTFSSIALEKFAELIILECARRCAIAVALREPASTCVSKILELKNER